jgi:molecular chaperone GrpE
MIKQSDTMTESQTDQTVFSNEPVAQTQREEPSPIGNDEKETQQTKEKQRSLEQQLAETEAQVAEFRDQWLRSVADYKNYKRRADTEREELKRNANASFILKLLPIVDDFERAVNNVSPDVAETPWWMGTRMIAQKFSTLLESEGVTAIESVGQEFDPNLHHAVMYEEAQGQDEQVIAELQKGYKIHERVLRPAMVKVGKG